MGEGPFLSESSSALPASERLDSWKEIAAYLRRDLRTVQRWEEQEGLPVHRHLHNHRASVYAFRSELDAWRANRQPDPSELTENGMQAASLNGAAMTNGMPPADSLAPTSPHPSVSRVAIRAGIGIALALALGVFAFQWRTKKGGALESIWLQENKVVAASQKNSVAWSYELPFQSRGLEASVILPANGPQKGADGVAAMFHADERSSDRLCFFSADGNLLWQLSPADTLVLGLENYGFPWRGAALKAFTSAGVPKIAATFQHGMWWPSILYVLDLDGSQSGKFVNHGWIRWIETLERPSGTLLLLFGVSNAYDGGMLAVLDANHPSGAAPSPPGSPYECTNCPLGKPLKYFVFPRSELNKFTASPLDTSRLRDDLHDIIVVTFETQPRPGADWTESVYHFSPDFQLLSTTYDDRYWEQHRQLELQGKIHHTRADCPERDGPPAIQSWDPEHGWTTLRPKGKTMETAHQKSSLSN